MGNILLTIWRREFEVVDCGINRAVDSATEELDSVFGAKSLDVLPVRIKSVPAARQGDRCAIGAKIDLPALPSQSGAAADREAIPVVVEEHLGVHLGEVTPPAAQLRLGLQVVIGNLADRRCGVVEPRHRQEAL